MKVAKVMQRMFGDAMSSQGLELTQTQESSLTLVRCHVENAIFR